MTYNDISQLGFGDTLCDAHYDLTSALKGIRYVQVGLNVSTAKMLLNQISPFWINKMVYCLTPKETTPFVEFVYCCDDTHAGLLLINLLDEKPH